MAVLIIADHNNKDLNPSTLNTISAAMKISQDIDIVVAGYNNSSVVEQASSLANIRKILNANDENLENFLD